MALLGRICALVAALGAAVRADAAPAADLVVVWAPGGDIAPVKAVADKRGAALIDRSPAIVPPPQTAQLLKKAIDAVAELRYQDAADPLDQAIGAVDRTGAAGLTSTQLADLFFTRSRLRYAQGSSTLGWDDLVESVVIDPTRVFDPALFSPKDLADIKRAQDAVQQMPQPFLVVDAPFGCAIAVDAKPTSSSDQYYVGTHWVRVTCPDREPWSARVELTAKGTKVPAQPALLAPPSDADVLVQARSLGVRALVVAEVHGKVATARLVGLDGRERDRRTVSVARDLVPLALVVDELLAPELRAPPALVPVEVGVRRRRGDRRRRHPRAAHRGDRRRQQLGDVLGQAAGDHVVRRALPLALAACVHDPTLVPVIDLPQASSDASPFPLESITVEVAHAGAPPGNDLVSRTFASGETLELSGVPYADDLVIHMTGFFATDAKAYGRTCEVAVKPNALPSPHLWFARTVHFANSPFTPESRTGGYAMAYHDGSALVVGGVDASSAPVVDVERFDPASGQFTIATQLAARTGAAVVPIGTASFQLAVIGGVDPSGNGAGFVEAIELDTSSDMRVSRVDDAQMARAELSATTLSDGTVVAIGGAPPGQAPTGDVDVVTLSGGVVTVNAQAARLAHPRRQHTAIRLGNDPEAAVLVAGGVDASGAPIPQAELYKPASMTFSTTFQATMVVPRTLHQAVLLPDGSVLFIGGIDGFGNPVRVLELFSLDAGFTPVSRQLPTTAATVDFTTTTLPDGRILLTGGSTAFGDAAIPTTTIISLDTQTGDVFVLPELDLDIARAKHQATLLCDGTVLISGGTADPQPAERYNPPSSNRR